MTHVAYPGCYCADCVEGIPHERHNDLRGYIEQESLLMQRERKERITKKEWYDRGGFANPALFRKQSRGGAWRYYVALDHHSLNT